jgi:hypothetical protein
MKILGIGALFLFMGTAGYGQALDLTQLEKLAAKANSVTDVTLDGSLLRLGAKFLSADDPDQAKVKKLVAELKGVYVRTYDFEQEGDYAESDLASIRTQLRSPGWSRIVGVQSKKDHDNTEIYLKTGGAEPGGLAIVCANPKQLVVVNIVGKIDLDELSELHDLGVPKLDIEKTKSSKPAAKKDND